MDDHDRVLPETHTIHHLTVIRQVPEGILHHLLPRGTELGELARMGREAMTEPVGELSNGAQLVRAVLERVSIFWVRGEGEHFRGHAHEADVL
jgi:hypothetical protein